MVAHEGHSVGQDFSVDVLVRLDMAGSVDIAQAGHGLFQTRQPVVPEPIQLTRESP